MISDMAGVENDCRADEKDGSVMEVHEAVSAPLMQGVVLSGR